MAKRTRSSSSKYFRFSLGTSVEARCSDIGFQGAWYEAKIIRTPRHIEPLYTVRYATIFAGNSNICLEKSVCPSFMRPRPPIELHSNNVFGLHQLVEAFHNDGWWPGVVSKLPSNVDGLYSVCFPASREEFVFKSLELRRSLEWDVKGEWISVEDYLLDDEEGEHVMFRKGTRVEVSRDRENFGTAWFVGTVVKFIGRTYFLVEYANIKVDSESSTEHPLKEIVDLQYIRPCPPMSESTSLVTDLSNLRILDPEQDFEEKLKVLDYLEKHGFNTQPARARLENLLEMRNLFGQLEEEWNSLGTQVEEVNKINNLLLSQLEKSIMKLKGEIANLKARVQAAEERTTSIKLQFDALVIAPW